MNHITIEEIKKALTSVRYPGTGKDIVSTGILQDNITIQDKKIILHLLFPKTNDPFAKSIAKATQQALHTYIDPKIEADINIHTPPPTTTPPPSILPNVKNIIAVFSGKGGVGKSTVATNLAISLAKIGYKVGLLDADIHGPSIPKMFDVEKEMPYVEQQDGKQKIIPIQKYGIKLLSIGFFVEKEKAIIWRGAMASNALKQLITETQWGDLDYFIMDLPPGTGDIHLTLVQTMGITGAVIVTTPQDVALIDAHKGINMFLEEKIDVPILGLIENMAYFTPAELPDNKYYLFGKEGGKKLAQKLDIPLLAQIPIVQSIREGGDQGTPVATQQDSITANIFQQLAQNVAQKTTERNNNKLKTKKVEITQK